MEKISIENSSEDAPSPEGEKYPSFGDFYSKYDQIMGASVFHQTKQIGIFICGKALEKVTNGNKEYYELVDKPSEKTQIHFHRITPHFGNVNVYKDGELVYYFRLTDQNINDFAFEFEDLP